MTKIFKKDIVSLCNCIQDLSYQHIKENGKGCFNHNIISWYNIKPYSGLNNWIEVFEKDNHKTKKEKHRLNRCKKSLSALEKVIQE